jgi:hypothetical protein
VTPAFAQEAADTIIGFITNRAWLPVAARAFALNKGGQFTGFAPVDVKAGAA